MSISPPQALRVAILGDAAGAEVWRLGLAARGAQVVSVADVAGLAKADPGLAVVFAAPERLPECCTQLARLQPVPPTVLLLQATSEDPHPHTRLVKTLFDAKNEWEGTFDAIVDPIALLDRSGTVRRANLELARALDEPIASLVSRPYAELLGPADGPDPVAQSLSDASPRTEETSFARLAGVQQVTTSPLLDSEGGLQGLVVILKDVNDLKEQQERLLQAGRLADIGQLAAGVAHEINTPLASIALRAEALLKAAEDPRLQAIDSFKNFPRYLKTIDEEIFRCKKIIGALLDFSRMRKPEARPTDLNVLAERAADLVGHQMKLKQIGLQLKLTSPMPEIVVDDGQLRQALVALLMNAIDATPAGGHVEISTGREDENGVFVAVADDGAGIPREHTDKIFSPFFTTKPVGQGTGLGLAVCHGIVASHGGEIRVDSEVGKGTRVALILPTRPSAGTA